MKKRVLAILLALTMLIIILPTSAFALDLSINITYADFDFDDITENVGPVTFPNISYDGDVRLFNKRHIYYFGKDGKCLAILQNGEMRDDGIDTWVSAKNLYDACNGDFEKVQYVVVDVEFIAKESCSQFFITANGVSYDTSKTFSKQGRGTDCFDNEYEKYQRTPVLKLAGLGTTDYTYSIEDYNGIDGGLQQTETEAGQKYLYRYTFQAAFERPSEEETFSTIDFVSLTKPNDVKGKTASWLKNQIQIPDDVNYELGDMVVLTVPRAGGNPLVVTDDATVFDSTSSMVGMYINLVAKDEYVFKYEVVGVSNRHQYAGSVYLNDALATSDECEAILSSKSFDGTTIYTPYEAKDCTHLILMVLFPIEESQTETTIGYYLSFGASYVELKGNEVDMPDAITVKVENGEAVTERKAGNPLAFEYGNDKYEIGFSIGNKEYVMHVNCKTVDAVTTVDTTALDIALSKANNYPNYEYSEGTTSRIVTASTEATEYPIADTSLQSEWETVAAEAAEIKANSSDQIEIDQKAIELNVALSAFESSVDAQLLKLSEGVATKSYSNGRVEYNTIKYKEGINLPESCADITSGFSTLGVLGEGFHTFVVNAEIDDIPVTKTYYFAIGSAEEDAEIVVATELERITPKPTPGGGGETTPISVIDSDEYSEFVDVTVVNGKINIAPKGGVKVERIAISADASGYMPLKNVSGTIDALQNGDNYVKLLLRTGNDTKAFVVCKNVDSCNTPSVQVYSGAVGIYSRGTNPSFVAYALGEYASLADALTAEAAGSTVVYYVKDGATLDKQTFDNNTYTFFFEDEVVEKVIN